MRLQWGLTQINETCVREPLPRSMIFAEPGQRKRPMLRLNMAWPMHRRVEGQAIRMREMMDRLNVDPAALVRLRSGDVYAEARARCLFCGTSDLCLRWLRGESRQDRSPDFCLNLSVFRSCARVPPTCQLDGRKENTLTLRHGANEGAALVGGEKS